MGMGASRNKKKTSPGPNPGGQQNDFFSPRDVAPQDIEYQPDNNNPSRGPGLNRPGRQPGSNYSSAPVLPKNQNLNVSQDPNVTNLNVTNPNVSNLGPQSKGKRGGGKTIVPQSLRAPCKVISETWADRVYFDEKELKRLRKRFMLVDYDQRGDITVEQFGSIIELISHPFRERVMNLAEDRMNSERRNRMSFDEFVRILSIFNYKCPIELKLKYVFRLYDINGDGYVDQKDISTMLKMVFFVKEMKEQDGEGGFETSLTNDEFVETMARDIIATYDLNGDKTLDLAEFKNMLLDGDIETRLNITF